MMTDRQAAIQIDIDIKKLMGNYITIALCEIGERQMDFVCIERETIMAAVC